MVDKPKPRPKPEEIQLARELLVISLNHWKAKLDGGKDLPDAEKDLLCTKCLTGVRLLLLSYGPNPGADGEFLKLLLLMQSMKDRKPFFMDKEPKAEVKETPIKDNSNKSKSLLDYA